ncbi:MAG: hypothetical protein AB8B86_13855 [Pseudomonadales bacterium]
MIAWKPKSNNRAVASVRYRCLMPLDALQKAGYEVELFDDRRLASYDAVIFSKLYDKKNIEIAKRLKRQGSSVILDICDNHLYNPKGLPEYEQVQQNLREMIGLSDLIVCASDALADVLKNEVGLQQRPLVIGDGIETLPANDGISIAPGAAKYNLLWFGNHGSPNAQCGMLDLLTIRSELESLSSQHSVDLHVVSNNEAMYLEHILPLALPTRYSEWSYETFESVIRGSNAILIPISNNPFSICKTNNRLVMGLSFGIPVIADRIPSYEEFDEFVALGDWQLGFDQLVNQPEEMKSRAVKGREYVELNWATENITPQWMQLLDSINEYGSPICSARIS